MCFRVFIYNIGGDKLSKKIELVKIDKAINLNMVEVDKFKSRLLVYNIIRPLKKEEASKNALLALILRRGTEKYPDNLTLQRKMEELYGVRLGINVVVRGNKHIIRFSLQFVDDRYVNDEGYLLQVIDLLTEIIFNPKLEDGIFNEDYLDQEKKNLARRIESRINNKRNYALERAIEEMCVEESFSIPRLGYVEDMARINGRNLYEYYQKLLKESPVEIFYTGKLEEEIINHLRDNIKIKRENILSFEREEIRGQVETIKNIKEDLDVSQGKMVLGYRTGIPYEDELYTSLLLAIEIFGGSPNSKLFLNVREKESLAYYIVARIFKYKSIILVDAGIEFDKFEETLGIIEEELNKMKNGDFSERDIEVAKTSMISSLESVEDSLHNILESSFDSVLTDDYRDVDEKIADIKGVTKEGITEASKHILLDTIYFMDNPDLRGGQKYNEDI